MTDTLKLSDHEISPEEIIPLLADLDLLPLFIKRYIQRKLCSHIKPTEAEQVLFQKSFLIRENISNQEDLEKWLSANDISEPQLSKQMYHSLQLKQFKENRFTQQVDASFLENKLKLDEVMYSMIRTSEGAKAYELHLRLNEEEDTFADLASEFSEGVEQQMNGLIGPIELGRINPAIAERLRISKPGQLWEPFEEQGWWVILRLEKLLPAKLDQSMKDRIIDDMYNNWIKQKIKEELNLLVTNNSEVGKILTPMTSQTTQSSPAEQNPSMFKKVWDKISSSRQKDQ